MDAETKKAAKEKVGEKERDVLKKNALPPGVKTELSHPLYHVWLQADAIYNMVGYPDFIMNSTNLDKVFNDVCKSGAGWSPLNKCHWQHVFHSAWFPACLYSTVVMHVIQIREGHRWVGVNDLSCVQFNWMIDLVWQFSLIGSFYFDFFSFKLVLYLAHICSSHMLVHWLQCMSPAKAKWKRKSSKNLAMQSHWCMSSFAEEQEKAKGNLLVKQDALRSSKVSLYCMVLRLTKNTRGIFVSVNLENHLFQTKRLCRIDYLHLYHKG